MFRSLVSVAAIVTLFLFVACGGDEKKSDDETLAGATTPVSSSETLPDDFPSFADSRFDAGAAQDNDGQTTYQGVWRTDSSLAEVRQYFENELPAAGWTIIDTTDAGDEVVIIVERPGEDPESGSVVIDENNGETKIIHTVRKGVRRGSGSSGAVATLPRGYPTDRVPLPTDAKIDSAHGPSARGASVYQVSFSSATEMSALSDYWRTTLPGLGWNLAFEGGNSSEFTLQYEGADASVTVTGGAAAAGSVGNVTLILRD